MSKKTYNLHLKGYIGGWDFDSDYADFVLGKNADNEVYKCSMEFFQWAYNESFTYRNIFSACGGIWFLYSLMSCGLYQRRLRTPLLLTTCHQLIST